MYENQEEMQAMAMQKARAQGQGSATNHANQHANHSFGDQIGAATRLGAQNSARETTDLENLSNRLSNIIQMVAATTQTAQDHKDRIYGPQPAAQATYAGASAQAPPPGSLPTIQEKITVLELVAGAALGAVQELGRL